MATLMSTYETLCVLSFFCTPPFTNIHTYHTLYSYLPELLMVITKTIIIIIAVVMIVVVVIIMLTCFEQQQQQSCFLPHCVELGRGRFVGSAEHLSV